MKRTEGTWDSATKIRATIDAMIEEAARQTASAAFEMIERCRQVASQAAGGTFCVNRRRQPSSRRGRAPINRQKAMLR